MTQTVRPYSDGSSDQKHTFDLAAGRAIALAKTQTARSIEALARFVRVPSLTGEEGAAQRHLAYELRLTGAEVDLTEPDTAELFRVFPEIAQYPTHWQHDLVLSYQNLPTYSALRASNLESVLNYHDRPNLVARFAGSGGGRSLILNGHSDTVTLEPRAEWTRDPFGAEIAGGRMYGRGTSDMKGGVMAAAMAMAFLREAGVPLAGDVLLQCVVNEEHAGNGTLDLVRRGFKADGAIVLEPTHNTISVSHPGGIYWQVTVPGIARSPGARWTDTVQQGVSAIEKLPVVIGALLDLERDYNARSPAEPGRAPFALVIGKVAGGHYETVTAASVLLKGGAYFSPEVGRVVDVMARLRAAIDQANAADSFLRENPARLEFLHHDDSTKQASDIAIASEMSGLLRERGGDGVVRPSPFCCDMRHLVNQGGIPAIIFGPGTIAEAHRPDESIDLQEYVDCIEHLIAFIPRWCNAAPQ